MNGRVLAYAFYNIKKTTVGGLCEAPLMII